MKIRFKKLDPNAVIPTKAHATDAGFDLVAVSKKYDDKGNVVYGYGIATEIPDGYVGLIFPRSSVSKMELAMANSVGVIDSSYRGELMSKFKPSIIYKDGTKLCAPKALDYEVGDRVAQLIILPYPEIEFELAEDLTDTDRGTGGYGSTGN